MSRRLLLVAFAMPLAACGGDPGERVVARIGGQPVTLQEFEAYVDRNLIDDDDLAIPDEAEEASVHSRLFDAFLDEQLLLAGARARGIEVSEDEIDLYLLATAPPDEESTEVDDPVLRRQTGEALMVQKYREVIVAREAEVGRDELDAIVDRRLREQASTETVVLRSLMLESIEQAEKVYETVRRRRLTFGEAVVQYGTQPGQGLPVEMRLDELPPEVREAVGSLRSGRVSEPVELHGDVYLFQLERRSGQADRLRRETETDLVLAQRRRFAERQAVDELRKTLELEVFLGALPFRYVRDRRSGE